MLVDLPGGGEVFFQSFSVHRSPGRKLPRRVRTRDYLSTVPRAYINTPPKRLFQTAFQLYELVFRVRYNIHIYTVITIITFRTRRRSPLCTSTVVSAEKQAALRSARRQRSRRNLLARPFCIRSAVTAAAVLSDAESERLGREKKHSCSLPYRRESRVLREFGERGTGLFLRLIARQSGTTRDGVFFSPTPRKMAAFTTRPRRSWIS